MLEKTLLSLLEIGNASKSPNIDCDDGVDL